MYSVSFAKHTLECSVIVVGVRRRDCRRSPAASPGAPCRARLRSPRRRRRWAHNLWRGGTGQTSPYSLWAECAGCLRMREVEKENKARRNAHMNMNMWMG